MQYAETRLGPGMDLLVTRQEPVRGLAGTWKENCKENTWIEVKMEKRGWFWGKEACSIKDESEGIDKNKITKRDYEDMTAGCMLQIICKLFAAISSEITCFQNEMERQSEGQTDRQTSGRTNGRTDERTDTLLFKSS